MRVFCCVRRRWSFVHSTSRRFDATRVTGFVRADAGLNVSFAKRTRNENPLDTVFGLLFQGMRFVGELHRAEPRIEAGFRSSMRTALHGFARQNGSRPLAKTKHDIFAKSVPAILVVWCFSHSIVLPWNCPSLLVNVKSCFPNCPCQDIGPFCCAKTMACNTVSLTASSCCTMIRCLQVKSCCSCSTFVQGSYDPIRIWVKSHQQIWQRLNSSQGKSSGFFLPCFPLPHMEHRKLLERDCQFAFRKMKETSALKVVPYQECFVAAVRPCLPVQKVRCLHLCLAVLLSLWLFLHSNEREFWCPALDCWWVWPRGTEQTEENVEANSATQNRASGMHAHARVLLICYLQNEGNWSRLINRGVVIIKWKVARGKSCQMQLLSLLT